MNNQDSIVIHSNHTSPGPESVALKRRRITRACDRCHKGGIKCAPSPDPATCAPCRSFGNVCTYDRPIKRRGPASKKSKNGEDGADPKSSVGRGGGGAGANHVGTAGPPTGGRIEAMGGVENGMIDPALIGAVVGQFGDLSGEEGDGWRAEHVASAAMIEQLVEGYHRIVYPILPYFHWPTFSYDVRRRRYLHDRPFFAATMAVCAISSARQRDGAQIPHFTNPIPDIPPSEVFYRAACNAIPKDLLKATDFDYKRAKSLLTMLCIQYGRVTEVKLHLGEVNTMCSLEGFHNESRWPSGLNPIEVEERRRLFWSIYQLDIYASVIWGLMTSHRESQITVLYPTEVNDDTEITSSGFIPARQGPTRRVSWLRGWNFVVDLYRVMEHATDRLRASRIGGTALDEVTGLYSRKGGPDHNEVLSVVARLYGNLPIEFKRVNAMTGNLEQDMYGFTATNIIITLQTLRSVIAGSEEANVHQRCTIAAEMLDALASVPVSYIQAGSAPMLHHLAGVGHLLGSIIQSPLSQHTYLRVRTVLLALADMLASLEIALSAAPDIATRLRAHVSRIDNYMTEAALQQIHGHQAHGMSAHQGPAMHMPVALPGKPDHQSHHPYLPSILGNYQAPQSEVRAVFPEGTSESASQAQTPQQHAQTDRPSDTPGSSSNPTSTQAQPRPEVGAELISPNPQDWTPSANVSPSQRFQLPGDLFTDWPFDFGQGDVFDWLGEVSAQAAQAQLDMQQRERQQVQGEGEGQGQGQVTQEGQGQGQEARSVPETHGGEQVAAS